MIEMIKKVKMRRMPMLHQSIPDNNDSSNHCNRVLCKLMASVLSVLMLLVPVSSVSAENDLENTPTMYVVGVSHLDTQWWWTIERTVNEYLPNTFQGTIEQFTRYPNYRFSWEGANRYRLLREYYPELYEQMKQAVADGRWAPAGSSVEGGDMNIPSPEALIRQFLYGNNYFRDELGKTSVDVFLPDCFGFGYSLPSIAAHCGLIGFSTQKLYWGPVVDIPFDIGVWRGPDGGEIIAALNPDGYSELITEDLSYDAEWLARTDNLYDLAGLRVAYRYFGQGDFGGDLDEKSLQWLETSIASDGPLKVKSAFSDELFRDLTPEQVARLPRYDGELLLTTHGSGAYTSQAALKRMNRHNERLANAAESAAVVAGSLGSASYPMDKINEAWWLILSHHFHDDLTGTGIPQIYTYSWNDEQIALNRMAGTLSESVGAVAQSLDLSAIGAPLVVYNPLSMEREDIVEAWVRFSDTAPEHVKVFALDGEEVPSQIAERKDSSVRVVFPAKVPSMGFAVYDVRPDDLGFGGENTLNATETGLENERFRVEIDSNGDVSSIFDKALGQELLKSPHRLDLFDDNSQVWPAWELIYEDLNHGPRESVISAPIIEVIENGPARATVQVTRTQGDSTYVQRIRLGVGAAGERVEFDLDFNWQTRASTLKATFTLNSGNPEATYDLGWGTITRGNNTERRYEVAAQQWADLSKADESWGVSILTEDKTGWDKPDDDTLRLTLVHTPIEYILSVRYQQQFLDIGKHRTRYAVTGHEGSPGRETAWHAARLNRPLLAFQTPGIVNEKSSEKELVPPVARALSEPETGMSKLSMVNVDTDQVMLMALKQAEDSEEVIVRLRELEGRAAKNVGIQFAFDITEAREVNGTEQETGKATLKEGVIVTDFSPYQTRTFALRLSSSQSDMVTPQSRPMNLEYDTDVASPDNERTDGVFDPDSGISLSADLFPAEVFNDGVRYTLGPVGTGEKNALTCRGQRIAIDPKQGERLFILAAALGDQEGNFMVGDTEFPLTIQNFTGWIGQWDSRVNEDELQTLKDDPAQFTPAFTKPAEIGWYGTHRHSPDKDDIYRFTYLFQYELPVPDGAEEIILPDNEAIRIFALTLADNPNRDILPASELFDHHNPFYRAATWDLPSGIPLEEADGDVEEDGDGDGDTDADKENNKPIENKDSSGGCSHSSPSVLMLLMLLILGVVRRQQ